MKYAFVEVHHIGIDGEAAEGRILHMSNDRFEELGPDGRGLVREATADEVKAGYQPPFEPDTTIAPDAPTSEGGEGQGGEKEAPAPENKAAPKPRTKAV